MMTWRFAFPEAFILFLLLGVIWWLRQRSYRQTPVLRYSDTRLLASVSPTTRVRLRRLPDVLRWLAWGTLITALARPQSGVEQLNLAGQGVDIVFAIDISNSMATTDFGTLDRLSATKMLSAQFIVARQYDRIGVVAFAEDAFYQAPPTLDYALLLELLEQMTFAEALGMSNRTALGVGIATSANILRSSKSASKVIILVTDGSNNAGAIDPITATQAAAAFGIRIYTIGMGLAGNLDLDEVMLQRIALASGGRYFNASTLPDLQQVYAEIDALEKSPIERQITMRWQEQFMIPLLLAGLLLIVERLLRSTLFQTLP